MATASIFHLWSESEAFIWFGFYANTDEVQAVQLCFKWIYSIQSCSLIHFSGSTYVEVISNDMALKSQSQANTPLL